MVNENQAEEREVLLSIYEGDQNFKDLSTNVYQYKYGEDGDLKSFLLEIKWGENYPDELPIINMDLFYNKHLAPAVRKHIVDKVSQEAENNLGFAMTFTLFEWVKECAAELVASQPDAAVTEAIDRVTISEPQETESGSQSSSAAPKVKKEVLSKNQKRKQWDRLEKGERPRGYDWVDVIKHLSQTGPKDPTEAASPAT